MGKTYDIAENLVKMAQKLKYGDLSAKDKVIEYAEQLIRDEFGSTSIYMQKLRMIVFTARDMTGLPITDAHDMSKDMFVFGEGVKRLTALLEQVRDSLGGKAGYGGDFILIHARDTNSLARISAYIKAKGHTVELIKDTDDWKERLDEILG